jgi:hypothetical protein
MMPSLVNIYCLSVSTFGGGVYIWHLNHQHGIVFLMFDGSGYLGSKPPLWN